MPSNKRFKTNYPGVFYREVKRLGKTGVERTYYIVFKKNGKPFEEKVGRQYADAMTEAKAARIRGERIEGKRLSRKEIREAETEAKAHQKSLPTIERIWGMYKAGKPATHAFKSIEYSYNKYLAPFSNKIPDQITTSDVTSLRDQIIEAGKSPQTAKHVLSELRRLIRFGVKMGLCSMPDPARLQFEMPRVDNEKTECLSAKQLEALKNALDEELDQNAASVMRLALVTGMRRGALLALKWDDIDFDSGIIKLRGEAAKKGKTERVPLNRSARAILAALHRSNSPYVFPGKNGEPRKDIRRLARRVKAKAGLPEDFRPLHGLRHTYASYLASSGTVNGYTLQRLLTHSSPQMTQRYAHLADEAMQRAASVADTLLLPSKQTD